MTLPREFRTLALWEDMAADELVTGGLAGLLPYAGLARAGTLDHVADASAAIEALPLGRQQRSELQVALLLLSGYRYSQTTVRDIISQEVLMQSPIYYELIKEGLEALQEVLATHIQHRVGRTAARRLLPLVRNCKELDRLKEVGFLLADPAVSGRKLVAQLTEVLERER